MPLFKIKLILAISLLSVLTGPAKTTKTLKDTIENCKLYNEDKTQCVKCIEKFYPNPFG
jgi:hypothetical protein